ncbi:MAG TPA: RNA 2',3'-cyclic phosphodiesterase [Methanospirillum sp.]|nr:RNA 2',3'-cyclic phosphodiesterase [Methanospirillum sp.]
MNTMVRLFVAAEITEDVRDQYAEVQEMIRQSKARLTLVDPADMHITLKFIGDVDGTLIPQITDVLRRVSGSQFTLDLGPVTANSPKSPRVIWGELHDDGTCRRLAGEIDAALSPLGIEAETRKFRPHITIARVRQFHQSLFEEIATITDSCSGSFSVDRFVLKKSELTPQGPIYTDILEVPL